MKKEEKLSPYQILNKWLYDKDPDSKIPQEVIESKAIGSQYILYFFQSSPYISWFSKLFNNYNVFQVPIEDILKCMKSILLRVNFKPRYIKKNKSVESPLYKCLKIRYPFLKKYEMIMLLDLIESGEDRDTIYEMFGLKKPKKLKAKKDTIELMNENIPIKEEKDVWTFNRLLSYFDNE